MYRKPRVSKASCIDSMSKFKQTTLFGSVVKQKDLDYVYKEPQNRYEKFVQLWYERAKRSSACTGTKQEIVKQAQVRMISVSYSVELGKLRFSIFTTIQYRLNGKE